MNKTRRVSALNFIGRRYDVGDKFGYIKATVEFALQRADLRPELLEYLKKLKPDEISMTDVMKYRKSIG